MGDPATLPSTPRNELPPKVPGLPLVGNLPRLMRQQLAFLEESRRQHGEIFRLSVGPSQFVALCHPRHAQHVLVDNARSYVKGGPLWDSIRNFLGSAMLVTEGEEWRRQRRMIQPAFHHQYIAGLSEKMRETIDDILADEWEQAARSGQPFNVSHAFRPLAMHVLVRTMFGSGMTQAEAEQVSQAMISIIDFTLKGMLTQSLPAWVPIPGRARYLEAIRTIDEVVFRMIARAEQGNDMGLTLLSLLLEAKDPETGERMTNAQLRDQAVMLFIAGYETTAVAMEWALHFLTQQPEIAQKLYAEVDTVLGSRTPTLEDLSQLPYTRYVLQEALRLNTPAYWIPRQPVVDDEIDGYRIPAGTLVAVLSHIIHNRADLWESPERFDPERFSPERSVGRHKLAWMPFGSGQRQCVGREFAMLEGQFLLVRLAQRFRVTAIPGRVAQPRFAVTLGARNGVWVKMEAR